MGSRLSGAKHAQGGGELRQNRTGGDVCRRASAAIFIPGIHEIVGQKREKYSIINGEREYRKYPRPPRQISRKGTEHG